MSGATYRPNSLLLTEDLIGLTAASRLPQLRRDGRAPALTTVFRWATKGVRGQKLETINCGGWRCTSREAVNRFLARITAEPTERPQAAAVASAHRLAEHELEAAGI
jgi:hypothetical protein